MKSWGQAVIVGALALAVSACDGRTSAQGVDGAGAARGSQAVATRPIPRLVDVGSDRCIPCKAMAPILAQLRADYTGRLDVTFVDAWKSPELAAPYGIRMIPTQIFIGADGRELARHQGFMSREEILAQWKALGVEL